MSQVPVPVAIDVDRRVGVRLTWEDGSVTAVDLATLRGRCPCAECRSLRERGAFVAPEPSALRLADAETVGGYGLGVTWGDGHRTGIYSWELLRSL